VASWCFGSSRVAAPEGGCLTRVYPAWSASQRAGAVVRIAPHAGPETPQAGARLGCTPGAAWGDGYDK
jgi:hypothetical protein